MKERVERTRTEYSARNTTVAFVSRIAAILMGYVVRVVFTHTLSEVYVGVNGLFLDIINILSLSEMGFESAISFALYEPIAKGDIEKQKSVMKLYGKFYRIVALIVAGAGFVIMAFLPFLVPEYAEIPDIFVIYLLYLLNAVLSYLLIYKKTLIEAHQLMYITTLYHTAMLVIQDVIQIIVLVLFKDFILYLLIGIFAVVIKNILVSRKADRMYPYLREKDIEPLPAKDKDNIKKNVGALFLHKTGAVAVNNTDNLIISGFCGIVSVGIYSNYYLIIGSVRQVLDRAFDGIAASIGNLAVTEKDEAKTRIFNALFFAGAWIYGFSAIALSELITPFVSLSFGENFVFPREIVVILCLNFFVTGLRKPSLLFHDSLGLFWYDRYRPVFEAVINIAVSLILVVPFGIAGVFFGTFISSMATNFWIEPLVVHRYGLHKGTGSYFLRYVLYFAVMATSFFLTHLLGGFIFTGSDIMTLLFRLPFVLIIPNAIFFLCFSRTAEFKLLRSSVRELAAKKRKGAA